MLTRLGAVVLAAAVLLGAAQAAEPLHVHEIGVVYVTKEVVVPAGTDYDHPGTASKEMGCPAGYYIANYLSTGESPKWAGLELSGPTAFGWSFVRWTLRNRDREPETVTLTIVCIPRYTDTKSGGGGVAGHVHPVKKPVAKPGVAAALEPLSTKADTVRCGKGAMPVSAYAYNDRAVDVQGSYPEGDAWLFAFANRSDLPSNQKFRVLCLLTQLGPGAPPRKTQGAAAKAKPPSLQVSIARKSGTIPKAGTGTVVASCPAGSAPIGGGHKAEGEIEALDASIAQKGYSLRVEADSAEAVQLTAYAVCLAKKTTKGT